MQAIIELTYATQNKEELTDLHSVILAIISYDVVCITVVFGNIRKVFKLEK